MPRMWGEREPPFTVGDIVNWFRCNEKQYGGLSKIKDRNAIWSSNFTLGIYLKKTKPLIWKHICTPNIYYRILILQDVKQTMDSGKEDDIYICICIWILAIKKEILPLETAWIDLEGIMLCEISQAESDKNYARSYTYKEFKKQNKQTNETGCK